MQGRDRDIEINRCNTLLILHALFGFSVAQVPLFNLRASRRDGEDEGAADETTTAGGGGGGTSGE